MDSEQYSDICKGNRLGGHITVIRLKISGQYNISHGLTISTQRCQRTYTYIHNWPLQPFSQDYGLASHCGIYSLTSTPNYRFLRNFFMAGLFTFRVFARNQQRGSRRRNIFHILFLMTVVGYELRLLRLISRHTTY